MDTKDFNEAYMHYYCKSGVKVSFAESNEKHDLLSVWFEGLIANTKMHLRSLEDMTEEEAIPFIQMVEGKHKPEQIGVSALGVEYTYCGFSRFIYFKQLSPEQFHYLLSKGFNLFDKDNLHTIKAKK